MLKSSASLFLGSLFVIIGAVNVWLILQASARVKNARASARLIAAHRIGGYIFILMFCTMSYFMISRLKDSSGTVSSGTMIHMTVAMLLTPLLFIKVLIARYYKSYYILLMPVGLLIFVLSFVLVAMAAGPYFIRNSNIHNVSLEEINLTNATMDLTQAAATMQERCSKCHNLERVVSARKDARGWLSTVNRMRQLPASGISAEDVKTIVLFLASLKSPEQSSPQADLAVGRALVNQRCAACHTLDRVYKTAKTPAEWRATVNKMVNEAQTDGNPGIFHPGEDQQIVDFLSKTQTPEAVSQRQAQASMAASNGISLVKPETDTTIQPMAEHGRANFKTAIFIFASCLGVTVLIVRRPGKIPVSSPNGASTKISQEAAGTVQSAPSSTHGTVILKLVRITRQTPDAKTLRFTLAENRHLAAKPGQFLTFSFLFDGKKVIRSYSICSSPAATGYVEITPKRIGNGCASIYLNDRAEVGMTVEASGPYGQFCLDEAKHKRVVLIAGGSGITPMMAMLRHIDDYCLPTSATLLYSVRTNDDIIFRSELEGLRTRLNNFQYHILLSQPTAEWSGPKGRLNREFVESKIKEPASNYFFICGPGPFMDAACQILSSLGVAPETIIQESFGSPPPSGSSQDPAITEPASTIEFVCSKKTHSARQGQTLLQAAEQCGVNIPSGCRQGQCGTCKVKLLAGAVSMDAEQGLPHDLKVQGYVLTCVGHAKGPVKLDV
ncbi:MAG TPA: photosystem P840 reaction-center cytochrome c-551 [Verrucomicrobiae bacterium]|nr:photosystem P840 reaction-center cytochrome c-551 [Verrucomicrobiae bacterium]